MTPYIRLSKKEYDPLSPFDEYDTSSVITEHPEGFVGSQKENDYKEFIAFVEHEQRKLKKWTSPDNEILRIIGELCFGCSDILTGTGSAKSFAVYGVDFIFSADFKPQLIGVDSIPIFANKEVLLDILSLIFSGDSSRSQNKFTKIGLI